MKDKIVWNYLYFFRVIDLDDLKVCLVVGSVQFYMVPFG